jgi:hypothetical protein
MNIPSPRLVQTLIGKSIAETLLVGALAVYAFMTLAPPTFHGWGEVTASGISGWAVNNASAGERVVVQLFVDGVFQATQISNQSRPDVQQAGWSQDEWHGYDFPLASVSPGRHEARIYALHASGSDSRKSLQLLGSPIPFEVDDRGRVIGRSRSTK